MSQLEWSCFQTLHPDLVPGQVDILDLTPRINPATGKTYGSNAAANWGYQFKAGFLDGVRREVITIYEIIRDAAGGLLWAVPDYQFVCVPGPTCWPLCGCLLNFSAYYPASSRLIPQACEPHGASSPGCDKLHSGAMFWA